MARLAPLLRQRYLDDNGDPLAGGKVYTYVAGTSTPLATYSDADGLVNNTNPVILDSIGECVIFMGNASYKFIVTDADDVTQFTIDDVNGNLTTATDGIDGRTILNGTVDPVSGDGSDGDFYLQTTDYKMFGPKASGAWPAGVALKGDTGDAATIAVGTVTTGSAGSDVEVTNSGDSGAAVFDFVIPKGDKGDTGANGIATQEQITGTYDGSDTTYELGNMPTAPKEVLAWMGESRVFQFQTVDYSISDKAITFEGEDTSSEDLFVFYRR